MSVGQVSARSRRADVTTYYAQHGEDRILSVLFSGRVSGVCVEVGAFDGVVNSNTLYFEERGWECLLVEANPQLCEIIRKRRRARLAECAISERAGVSHLVVGGGAEDLGTIESGAGQLARIASGSQAVQTIEVETQTLDEVLEEAGIRNIDFISIDVEGHELAALRGFDLGRWRPTVVILENNEHVESRRIATEMGKAGYRRVFRTGCNDWYCHEADRGHGSFWRFWRRSGAPLGYRLLRAAGAVLLPRSFLTPMLRMKRWASGL